MYVSHDKYAKKDGTPMARLLVSVGGDALKVSIPEGQLPPDIKLGDEVVCNVKAYNGRDGVFFSGDLAVNA